MRIVKPTSPPSMGVLVDTVTTGIVELVIQPAYDDGSRVDVVYAGKGTLGVALGPKEYSHHGAIESVTPPGMRALARVHVHRGAVVIHEGNIEEVQ